MSEYELRPCPFCGGEAHIITRYDPEFDKEERFDVGCNTLGCYAEYGADFWVRKEVAVALWNQRSGDDSSLLLQLALGECACPDGSRSVKYHPGCPACEAADMLGLLAAPPAENVRRVVYSFESP